MPGGYGTDESLPWGSSGDTGYVAPVSTGTPNVDTPNVNQGGGLDLSWLNLSDPQTQADIAASGTTQPTTSFVQTGGYDDQASPYFTTGYPDKYGDWAGTIIPEQKPITAPSDMMIGNLLASTFAKDPKYGKEFVDTKEGFYPTNTLGKIMAIDSSGNPILDSSGNPVWTEFGKKMVDEFQGKWDPDNPIDITLPNEFDKLLVDEKTGLMGLDYLKEKEKEYFLDRFDKDWYGGDWDEYLGEPYGGYPESASLSDPKYWAQKSLGELNPTGFANLEQMYGEELANKMAAPHAWGIEPFSEMIIEGDY